MADAPASLGDFFAKKQKKKAKGLNLNNEASTAKVEDNTGKKKKDKADDEWEEEKVLETTMNVSVAGRLKTREEEEKEEGEDQKAAWGGGGKAKKNDERKDLNERRFPTLQKSVVGPSSNIHIEGGGDGTINIKTTKNAFAQLQDDDDDEDGPRRPNHIKPAMVTKKKGEFESAAIKREVDKYSKKDDKSSKKKKKKDDSDSDEEEEEDEEGDEEEEAKDAAEAAEKRANDKKKSKAVKAEPEKKEVEKDEDCLIAPDEKASRAKYIGRAKLETKEIPQAEKKAEKKAPQNISNKKKKFQEQEEEDSKGNKRLLVADWD